jgi:integrase
MPLKIIRRKDRDGALTIIGTVAGQRVRRRAQSDSLTLAREEASAIETEILRTEWHGERRGTRSLAEAIVSYLEAEPRSERTKERLRRILGAIGNTTLSAIDQDAATRLREIMLRAGAGPAAYAREVIVPLRALMLHAHKRGWCHPPQFSIPRQPQGRTRYLLPLEAERLILAAAPHLKPLLTFLICTGARMSEALELEWRDVDMIGARAIFWKTKNGKRRVVGLPYRVLQLSLLPKEGPVFRTATGLPYAAVGRQYGGQIKTGWAGAIRRSGIDPGLTPHDLRHTWATWHYAVHKDLLALKDVGGWSSVALVERYAHLMPGGHEEAIRDFWHQGDTGIETDKEIA